MAKTGKDQYIAAQFGSLAQYGHVTRRRIVWSQSEYGRYPPGFTQETSRMGKAYLSAPLGGGTSNLHIRFRKQYYS